MRSLRSVESFSVVALALALGCLRASTALSDDDLAFEPYSVFVAEEESYAYCGPSDEYYRTDPLRYGQTLEVYAETENGWLGIRPPDESFCWIPADTVEMEPSKEEGMIIEDRTVAWIGTHLGRARKYRWQVQLAMGEPVTVVGRSEREGPDGPQLWYRIVPPSGEYRWVHRDSVVMTSEELVETVKQRAEPKSIARTEPNNAHVKVATTARPAASRQGIDARDDNLPQPASAEPKAADSSGESILDRDRAIGSGLSKDWETPRAPAVGLAQAAVTEEPQTAVDAFKQGGLLASLEFLTRPRLQDIGEPQTAPHATDSNWVAGENRTAQHSGRSNELGRSTTDLGTPIATPASLRPKQDSIIQVSSQTAAASQSMGQSVSPAAHSFNVVPAQRIAQIEAEASHADLDRLNLILSRLMASQASAAETEPIERAAKQMAGAATDSVTAGRARTLAETAERYRQIATRRDGQSIIQANATVPVGPAAARFTSQAPGNNSPTARVQVAPTPPSLMPAPTIPPQKPPIQNSTSPSPEFRNRNVANRSTSNSTLPGAASSSVKAQIDGSDRGNGVMEQSGYLVQVYSARSNSPPFALTDNTGRTVAYVTPSPGVNIRTHLNSRINVVGTRGFLTGLNTPHILVTQAIRTPE